MHFTSTVFLSLLAGASAVPTMMGTSEAPTRILAGRAAVRTFPKASGSTTLSSAQSVSGTFDGGMKRYERNNGCNGQNEGGDKDAVFLVQSGGTLKNVIIGAKQSEGVHCMGPCTIQNVWWEDVCEDALTIKQESGTSNIIGGGAKGADDKVVQHNGGGTVNIRDFYVSGFGKLYRSCGNCKKQYKRTVTVDGVYAESGKVLVGINSNYGDTATIKNTCAKSVKEICDEYTGNDTGKEPTKKSSGPSSACKYSTSDTSVGC